MKFLNLIMWLAILFAILLVLLGIIDFIGGGNVFVLKHSSTFFTMANSSLLFAVVAKLLASDSNKN